MGLIPLPESRRFISLSNPVRAMAEPREQLDFRKAVCLHFRCTPTTYEETVFAECLYPHATDIARLVRRFSPDYFASDFELIRLAANKTSTEELRAEVRVHRSEYPPNTLLRRFLRVRLSGQRMLDLAEIVFTPPPAPSSSIPAPPEGP